MRKNIKKSDRLKTYEKFKGHCAYCGKEIQYKEMRIDHIRPHRELLKAIEEGFDIDDIENLNPSCCRCNHYKRSLNLEKFREYMMSLHERIIKNYIVKVGIDYGIVNITPFSGKFYFEKEADNGSK